VEGVGMGWVLALALGSGREELVGRGNKRRAEPVNGICVVTMWCDVIACTEEDVKTHEMAQLCKVLM
jgi:hypothetical protein